MTIKLNEETLTAYVLGELEADQVAAVKEALKANDTARCMVEELRATAKLMGEAGFAEPAIALSEEQREAIHARAEAPGNVVKPPIRRWRPWLAVAATLVVIAGGAMVLLPALSRTRGFVTKGPMWLAEKKMLPPEKQAQVDELVQTMREEGVRREPIQRFFIADVNNPDSNVVPEHIARIAYEQAGAEGVPTADKMKHPAVPSESPAQSSPVPLVETEGLTWKAAAGSPVSPSVSRRGRVSGTERARLGVATDLDLKEAPRQEVQPEAFGYDAGNQITIGQPMPVAAGKSAALEGRMDSVRRLPAPGPPHDDPYQVYWPGHNTESYDSIVENEFKAVTQEPLSTFSIDVDTASYANMRRFLNQGTLPPPDAVRIEELVNYFAYDYAPPRDLEKAPFASHVTVAGCPWTPEHRLVRIGLKGWEIPAGERPPTNLVFLVDVSGSMGPRNKLPLLKEAMKLLAQRLGESDRVAIVVYAGSSGLVLPSTSGDNRQAILGALDRLQSGGSTNGGEGIELAYNVAIANYIEGGVNRVILATDGDFNVGVTNRGDLTRMVEKKAKSGVFLTILGFGMGNVKDATLEELSNKGNGNYAYIDTLKEARKVLVEEMGANLVTIAKDVKIQVEFNPAEVRAYRLIGYENRMLAAEDFNDDTKDAGEIGAGHTVTALYEIVPAGVSFTPRGVDPLKYQQPKPALSETARTGELMTLKLRYKAPDGDKSKLLVFPVVDPGLGYAQAEPDFKFAASVASFGMILRHSKFAGRASFDSVLELAEEGRGEDVHGYRAEFIDLVKKAKRIAAAR